MVPRPVDSGLPAGDAGGKANRVLGPTSFATTRDEREEGLAPLSVTAKTTIERRVMANPTLATPGLTKLSFEDEFVGFESASHGVIIYAGHRFDAMQ